MGTFTTGQLFFFGGIAGLLCTFVASGFVMIHLHKVGKRLHEEIWEEYWKEPGM